MNALHIFIVLLIAHALADYPLQGDFLSKAKNRFAPILGVPWYQAMGAHVVIQAGFVWLITGSALCAAGEAVIHAVTDDAKCGSRITFNTDQSIHLACKFAWAWIATTN